MSIKYLQDKIGMFLSFSPLNAIRLYFRYLGISIRSQMQYRASFVMMSLGHFLTTGIEIFGIWALFDRFGSLRGWRLPEVALFYGMINIAFAIAEAIGRGFDVFSRMVKSGDFDQFICRVNADINFLRIIVDEKRILIYLSFPAD